MGAWKNAAIMLIATVSILGTMSWVQPAARSQEPDEALLTAAERGHGKAVADLIESGSSVDARRKGEGSTPLMLACAKGHTEVIKALLDKGADVNARNVNGWTALMAAAANDHLDAVKILLDRGADVNSRHTYGYTALKLAKQKKLKRIEELLTKSGAKQ
jgi:ankyrin repeat protein